MSQVAANALIAAAAYALLGISFALSYRASRFFHLTHGAVYVIGAYGAYATSRCLGPASIVFGAVIAGIAGAGAYVGLYRPMESRRATRSQLLVASLGAFVAVQNVISLGFGDEMLSFDIGLPLRVLRLGDVRVTNLQALVIVLALAFTLGLWAFLELTVAGLLVRAVCDDAELARARGIPVERVTGCAFFLSSSLAGEAGGASPL